MVTLIAIIPLLFIAIALCGLISLGVLAVVWGPAAFAAFAAFVTLHRADADGLITVFVPLITFIVVRMLTGKLLCAGLRITGLARAR